MDTENEPNYLGALIDIAIALRKKHNAENQCLEIHVINREAKIMVTLTIEEVPEHLLVAHLN